MNKVYTLITFFALLISNATFATTSTEPRDAFDMDSMRVQDDARLKLGAFYMTDVCSNLSRGNVNWTNFLTLSLDVGTWRGGRFVLRSVTTQTLFDPGTISDDRQTFSGIVLSKTYWLRLYQLGIYQKIGPANLFFGLRRIGADHFNQPITSLFTGSPSTIYSTVCDNFPVVGFPLLSMCFYFDVHFAQYFTFKNSLYNGAAYVDFGKQFSINPSRDGVFNISEISYKGVGDYYLGFAFHTKGGWLDVNKGYSRNVCRYDGSKFNYTLWFLGEQPLVGFGRNGLVSLLMQLGCAPREINRAYGYGGVGIVAEGMCRNRRDKLGLLVNRSLYSDNINELGVELTYSYPVTKWFSVQPALHYINTGGNSMAAGILRLVVDLNYEAF